MGSRVPSDRQPSGGRPALQYMKAACEVEQEPNMPLAHLAREFKVTGPAYNCLTACAASTEAIGEAFDIIRGGQ